MVALALLHEFYFSIPDHSRYNSHYLVNFLELFLYFYLLGFGWIGTFGFTVMMFNLYDCTYDTIY